MIEQMVTCREFYASPADVLGPLQKSVEQAIKVARRIPKQI